MMLFLNLWEGEGRGRREDFHLKISNDYIPLSIVSKVAKYHFDTH